MSGLCSERHGAHLSAGSGRTLSTMREKVMRLATQSNHPSAPTRELHRGTGAVKDDDYLRRPRRAIVSR